MAISAGSLKDRVSFFRMQPTQNDSGGSDFDQVEYLKTYAQVEELSSSPELLASQENVKQVVRVRIRYRKETNFINGDLMTWRGFKFVLNNFKVDPFRTYIEMNLFAIFDNSHRLSDTVLKTFGFTFDATFGNMDTIEEGTFNKDFNNIFN
ncbi:phage head-tail joining protein [Cellulophaga phage phi12:1]|uniref:Phage head-tail joining protein n=2 Tax=Cellulophaga phage phi12:1 TaxID=1327976 RepID=R9ZZQ8_9CAUD|nr:head closure Hc1 [Cellulophaga phage phi12:1]AGO48015.1 phage head-tail joining protein [Cellulophaga phage phi12:1]AGO48180.1 phage head-tail joining protein [Cellulophaga phage phi12:3]